MLHALLYLREILRTGNIDLSKALAGSQTVNLGGIKNLLHCRDGFTSPELRIGISVSLRNQSEKDPLILPEEQGSLLQKANSLFPVQFDSYDLHITVGCNGTDALWRVTHSEIFINSESFVRFSLAGNNRAVGTINLLHPALSINLDHILHPIVDMQTEWKRPNALTIKIAEQDLDRYRQACIVFGALTQTEATLPQESNTTFSWFMQLGLLEYPREIRFGDSENQMIQCLIEGEHGFLAMPYRDYMKARGAAVEWIDTIDNSVLVILDESQESRQLPVAILFGPRRDAKNEQIPAQPDSGFRNDCVRSLRRAWVTTILFEMDAEQTAQHFDVEQFDFGGHAFPVAGRHVLAPAKSRNSFSVVPRILEAKSRLLQFVSTCTLGLLERLTYIGPKRATVPRNLNSDVIDEFSNWGDGLGAWHWMLQCSDDDLEICGAWLDDATKGLGTGFSLRRQELYEVERHAISEFLCKYHPSEYLAKEELLQLEADVQNSRGFRRISLIDRRANRNRHPQDVGEGVTQVIPVIAALVRASSAEFPGGALTAIEQPELHLHPSLAARVGDLVVATSLKNCESVALIETHSEHLILRILRRIRQTTDGELPEHIPPVKPDDVCVLWVDNLGDGTTFTRLRISDNGRWLDRWPDGFFSERHEELFE